jgi:3'-5' exoribonuclease
MPRSMSIVTLAEMSPGQEADLFLLLTVKEELKTKAGKPYYRVAFRDSTREVGFPIWGDSPWAVDCRDGWNPGVFYKLRAVLQETNYGPQLDIRKIREVVDADAADGFDPNALLPRSRFDPRAMFDELLTMARKRIADPALRAIAESMLLDNRDALLVHPAARRNHHAYISGLLEHTLSVARTCVFLADKYADYYPDQKPPLNKDLVVAGGILHDIGKLREMEQRPEGATHTPEGSLIGHILMGRDMLREAASAKEAPAIEPETLLRLEHVMISHQGKTEWGAPKVPMTPEAMLVHAADDIDAKYAMMLDVLENDTTPGPVTSKKNVLMQHVYKGEIRD